MSFSLTYANADGSVCTPCALCEGSSLHNVFTTNAASLCISCTDESACDEAIVMSSFETGWGMTYASLTSHEGDAISDPESIAILGSDDYDESSKTGSWTILATSSSDLLFTKRNESYDVVVDNDALYAHYRFVFSIKDNSKPMKIGHIGVVESYLKTYAVELFEKLTELKVGGLPSKAPTDAPTHAPTHPVGPEFTNESLKTAVNEWTANKSDAFEKYGEMKYWGTRKVTSMTRLFYSKNTFNEDLTLWDTSNVTDMAEVFSGASSFNADVSQWNTSNVQNMELAFSYTYSFNNDVSKWDVSSVTMMKSLFNVANRFNQDISGWDTRSVLNMDWMFFRASAFNIDVSDWNISSVTVMNYMFHSTTGFNQQICWNTLGKKVGNIFTNSAGGNRC